MLVLALLAFRAAHGISQHRQARCVACSLQCTSLGRSMKLGCGGDPQAAESFSSERLNVF